MEDDMDLEDLTSPVGTGGEEMRPLQRLQSFLATISSLLLLTMSATPNTCGAAARMVNAWGGSLSGGPSAASTPQLRWVHAAAPCAVVLCCACR